MTIHLSVELPHVCPLDQVAEHATTLESLGFYRVWIPDTIVSPWEAWLVAGMIASRTEHLKIGLGVTNPYTSLNGHMFSHLSKDGSLGLRLPKEEREAFLERYNTSLYESYGAIMKEYVAVPDDLLQNTDELKPYLDISYEYVKTLKPKPTKKKS